MNIIGGFLELELGSSGNSYHKTALSFSTGRSCLNFILKQIKPKVIHIPYYTCDAIFSSIKKNNIEFKYYSMNEDFKPERIKLKDDEYILYINYFGIKIDIIKSLIDKYGSKIIVDNSQGFFEKGYEGIWSFNSARKFFGVPDGAYLYSPFPIEVRFQRNTAIKYDHLIQRLLGNQERAYDLFLENEDSLNSDLKNISRLSEFVLDNIDYEQVAKKRLDNFQLLHERLKKINQLSISNDIQGIPLCYPFMPMKAIDKKTLHKGNLFIPSFWDRSINLHNYGFEFEKKIMCELLPLPIDQRYGPNEMISIIEKIKDA